jgi:hypothetical protein
MAVLGNRGPPRMHPGCTDPLSKFVELYNFQIAVRHEWSAAGQILVPKYWYFVRGTGAVILACNFSIERFQLSRYGHNALVAGKICT